MGLDETHLDSPRTSCHTSSSNATYDYMSEGCQREKEGRDGRGKAEPTVSIIKYLIHIIYTRSITRSKAQGSWKLTSTVNKNVDALQSVLCGDEGYL